MTGAAIVQGAERSIMATNSKSECGVRNNILRTTEVQNIRKQQMVRAAEVPKLRGSAKQEDENCRSSAF